MSSTRRYFELPDITEIEKLAAQELSKYSGELEFSAGKTSVKCQECSLMVPIQKEDPQRSTNKERKIQQLEDQVRLLSKYGASIAGKRNASSGYIFTSFYH